MSKKIILGVYGLLRQGLGLNPYLQTSKFLGRHNMKINYKMMLNYSIASLNTSKEKNNIVLEFYEVDMWTKKRIDHCEMMYREETIQSPYGEAIIYTNAFRGTLRIENGDYLEFYRNMKIEESEVLYND